MRAIGLSAALLILLVSAVDARDNGQWGNSDSESNHAWVRSLQQPDNPYQSCCGDADAYWADEYTVEHGQTVATITDDRDDEPLGRPHRPIGTKVIVPDNKMKWDAGNPTGHGWLFLAYDGHVYCYVTPGGV